MSEIRKNLGGVTAYAYAKSKGYTGTEDEFAQLMANYATVGQAAEEAAEQAIAAEINAESAAQTATTKASEASSSANSASSSASAAATSETNAAASATAAATSAGNAAGSATAAQAAQAAAERVEESIPEDYSELSADVEEIKGDLSNVPLSEIYTPVSDIINGKFIKYNNGDEAAAGTAHCTNFISISDYDSFHLVCSVLGLACGMAVYDINKTFVASYYTQTTGDVAHEYDEYILKANILSEHSNVAYVRFGSLYDLTVETGSLETATLDEFSLKVVDDAKKLNAEVDNDFIASVFPPVDDNVQKFTALVDNTFIKYNNGDTASASGAHCTDYIPLGDYIYFRLNCYSLGLACGMAVYNSNKEFIASYFTQTSGNVQKHFDVAVYVHDIFINHPNAVYVRFGSLSSLDIAYNVPSPSKNIFDLIGASNVLYSKKYYALGDSFTHGDWTGYEGDISDIYDSAWGVYKTYPYWIAKRNHMDLTNLAVNGSTIVALVARGDYSAIPADCDYATIMIGLNDTTNTENEPLGNIDTTDTTTWYGCWNTVMSWLRTNRPHLHFGVLIVSAYMSEELREATRLVCAKYGYPYLDMYKDTKVPAFMGKYGMNQSVSDALYAENRQSPTNGHPTLDCQKFMSTFIESFIRQI